MRWLVAICAGAGWLCAQEAPGTLSPELLLLTKVRRHAIENLARQPNYTCVETVERTRRSGTTKKFQLVDTLRLEVGLVNGKEVFAWPGAKTFEDTDVTKMVAWGTIGNGSFALHERAIFEGASTRFEYRGEETLGDRRLARFDYVVPLMMSGYTLHVSNREAVVGYHGSIYADPKSLDLRRLVVVADDIPLRLGIAEATDQVEYARVAIGDRQFLLPEASELKLTDLEGSENRNRTSFRSCREFTGESVLTFDDAPRSTPAPAPREEIALPANMAVQLVLLDDLNLRSGAVGDLVRARLQNDLKHNGQILFAKGATATGRVSRLERHSDFIAIGIEFSEIESGEARGRLNLKLEEVGGWQLFQADTRKSRPPEPRPGEGIIVLRPDRSGLAHGILMFWRTTS